MDLSVVIPAYDEAGRIGTVLAGLDADEVIVVDDGSTDGTAARAREAGATVVEQGGKRGYVAALKHGFREARGGVIVTMDADGEHRPRDVERVAAPVLADEADLVFGARRHIPRASERLLNRLARLRVDATDTGSGLRAIRASLARDLDLDATCTCGTLALEADRKGARIAEVPIRTAEVEKPRGIARGHGRQLLHVLRYLP